MLAGDLHAYAQRTTVDFLWMPRLPSISAIDAAAKMLAAWIPVVLPTTNFFH